MKRGLSHVIRLCVRGVSRAYVRRDAVPGTCGRCTGSARGESGHFDNKGNFSGLIFLARPDFCGVVFLCGAVFLPARAAPSMFSEYPDPGPEACSDGEGLPEDLSCAEGLAVLLAFVLYIRETLSVTRIDSFARLMGVRILLVSC